MPCGKRGPKRPGLKIVKRPGSAALYLRGSIGGRRIFESAGTDDPALAAEARATREAELFRACVHGPGPARVSFSAALASYLAEAPRSPATITYLQRISRYLGQAATCQDIDQVKVDSVCRALCRPDAKPATRQRCVVTPLRAVLRHAAWRGWCTEPRLKSAKASPARTEWIRPAEAEDMLAACTKRLAHMRPILAFLFCTGARVGEMVALEMQDLDLPPARAVLRDTKNGRDRQVDLPPRLVAELATAIGRRPIPTARARRTDNERPAVFLDRARRPYRLTDEGGYGGQIGKSWAAVLKAAGVTRQVTPHHARHTWASWHYALHRDLLLLKADGDWSSVSLVERYAKLVPNGLEPQIRRFLAADRPAIQATA